MQHESEKPSLPAVAALSETSDVLYIITGNHRYAHGAKGIDPSMIEPILVAINAWSRESKQQITETRRAELLALFLEQANRTGKIETDWMSKTLQLMK